MRLKENKNLSDINHIRQITILKIININFNFQNLYS